MRAAALAGLLLFLGACTPKGAAASGSSPPSKEAREERQEEKLPGEYTCTFEAKEQELGDSRCAITRPGGGFVLEASGGNHLIEGELTPTEYGFKFAGSYECSEEEDCTEEVRTDFFENEEGVYTGLIELLDTSTLLTVTLTRTP